MDDEGLEAVTMRRIGRELGVEAMSLYNHVEDKEDILEGITERVMREFEFPDVHRRLGRGRPRDGARVAPAPRPASQRLPAARGAPQAARGPRDLSARWTPRSGVLRRAGLSERDAAQAFNALGGYILGFVMMEQGLMLGNDDEHARRARSRDRGPAGLRRSSTWWSASRTSPSATPDQQFEFGLDLMIRGHPGRGRRILAVEPLAQTRAPRPTRPNTSSASPRSSSVWSAVTIVRTRAVPLPTVGNTIAGQNTPSSNSRRANACVRSSSPVITGVIGVSLAPVSNPSSCSPALNERGVRPEPIEPLGLVLDDVERLDAGGDGRRRRARREQVGPAPVLQPLDQLVRPGDEPAQHADRLRERADLDVDPAVQAEVVDGARRRPCRARRRRARRRPS